MARLKLSFSLQGDIAPQKQVHRFGNIADDVWKEKLALEKGEIISGRYIATMKLVHERDLRKKEKDRLIQKLKSLPPELDAQIEF